MEDKECTTCKCKVTTDRFIDICEKHETDENNGLLIQECDGCWQYLCSNCKIICYRCDREKCKHCVRKCDMCQEIYCRARSTQGKHWCNGIDGCSDCNLKMCGGCYYSRDHNCGTRHKHKGGYYSPGEN